MKTLAVADSITKYTIQKVPCGYNVEGCKFILLVNVLIQYFVSLRTALCHCPVINTFCYCVCIINDTISG